MTREESEDTDSILDVLDLPHISTQPPLAILLPALDLLAIPPPSWDLSPSSAQKPSLQVIGNPGPWLTSLVSSGLKWLPDDDAREMVWETASLRLAERCGRTAMPDIDRCFRIADNVEIKIHEPSLDGDNLGLKTWGAAYVLGKRIARDAVMKDSIRGALSGSTTGGSEKRVLELGSGTGLVGLSLAASIHTTLGSERESKCVKVDLTDLPAILPNLQRNVEMNQHLLPFVEVSAFVLDWSLHTSPKIFAKSTNKPIESYPLIVVADPLYSLEHPKLLSTVVSGWLEKSAEARFILEIPRRILFNEVVVDFRRLMSEQGFIIVEEGEEDAMDDWGDAGESMKCWWVIYAWDMGGDRGKSCCCEAESS
ncbi:hypothetical protein TWF694_009653 [Orbilia ellipsospora]|uniref:Uncharacterized protein n=1 Tax=Orbilia ellipsospora TaxID=2528407 RepID=A0AAV9XBZ0_9PEZI